MADATLKLTVDGSELSQFLAELKTQFGDKIKSIEKRLSELETPRGSVPEAPPIDNQFIESGCEKFG